jgi:hypothetical protein
MYIWTSWLASFLPPCNGKHFVCLFLCQATECDQRLEDCTFQHEASFTLPRIAGRGSYTDVDKLCSRIFLLCTPFWRTKSAIDDIYIALLVIMLPNTDTLSHHILVLNGTKHQLSVYNKMPMSYVLLSQCYISIQFLPYSRTTVWSVRSRIHKFVHTNRCNYWLQCEVMTYP